MIITLNTGFHTRATMAANIAYNIATFAKDVEMNNLTM